MITPSATTSQRHRNEKEDPHLLSVPRGRSGGRIFPAGGIEELFRERLAESESAEGEYRRQGARGRDDRAGKRNLRQIEGLRRGETYLCRCRDLCEGRTAASGSPAGPDTVGTGGRQAPGP